MHKILIGILLLAPLVLLPAAPVASYMPLAKAAAVASVGGVVVTLIGGGTLVARTRMQHRRKNGR